MERAKNILKSKIYLTLERQTERLEEAAKNVLNNHLKKINYIFILFKVASFNKLLFPLYNEMIESVTSEQINELINKTLKTEPTLVLLGKDFSGMPEINQIKNYFINN